MAFSYDQNILDGLHEGYGGILSVVHEEHAGLGKIGVC